MCGVTLDGKRLRVCSLSECKSWGPAADMSAPESGSACVSHEPLVDSMRILTVGAGSVAVTYLMVDSWES